MGLLSDTLSLLNSSPGKEMSATILYSSVKLCLSTPEFLAVVSCFSAGERHARMKQG